MSKKKSRSKYTSKGTGRNVNKDILKSIRKNRTYLQRRLAQLDAHKKGKPTYLTHKKGEYDPRKKIDEKADYVKQMGYYKMKITPIESA